MLQFSRLILQCTNFLIAKKFIQKKDDFFCANPPNDAPLFIIAWIMEEYVEPILANLTAF